MRCDAHWLAARGEGGILHTEEHSEEKAPEEYS
jgi:hypothetical protein